MDQGRWERLQQLFAAAAALEPRARDAFLRRECGDDEALLQEVESLLAADEVAAGAGAGDPVARDIRLTALIDDVEVGMQLDRYRIDSRIGQGSMGVVYKAFDSRLGRTVALKVLPAYLKDVEGAKARFVQEARAASALDHPNICTVHEIGETPQGSLFIAMTFCEGRDLRHHLDSGELDWRKALNITAQLAAALETAHSHGIVHRDLKPGNVIVGQRHARIVDFGIAKISGSDLTDKGIVLGTLAYMSPEQLRGKALDGRSDIWALGVMLYEMLCGVRPFAGDDVHSIRRSMSQPPLTLLERGAKIPASSVSVLQTVLDLSLAIDPDQRYASMRELIADLQQLGVARDDELGLAPAEQPDATGDLPSGQLRRMTVLECVFTSADPEVLLERLPQLKEKCTHSIGRYEGLASEPGGESIRAWFGYPRAHEDDAARAVRAALEIIAAVADSISADGQVAAKIAVHSGPMVMRPTGGIATLDPTAMIGNVARDAAALAASAPPATLLISAQTRAIVDAHFDCTEHGSLQMEAGRDQERVYRVLGHRPKPSGEGNTAAWGATRLFGRDHELAMLKTRWQEAGEGRGQCVLIGGEPGIGKTRLTLALEEYVSESGDATIMHCRCSGYQRNAALYPIIELLNRELDQHPPGSAGARLDSLENIVQAHGYEIAEAAPLLAGLLGIVTEDRYPALQLSPERQRRNTLDLLLGLTLRRSSDRPLLFIAEDLHWADPTFIDLLASLIDQVPAARILVVLTCRPEFDVSRFDQQHVGQVNLSRLTDQDTREMIAEIAAGHLNADAIARLTRHVDGVPLFVEELTKSVLESQPGESTNALPLFVPATLQESLAVRLDRLGVAKATAQRAAVIGREFGFSLLRSIDRRGDDALNQDLNKLVSSGLLFRRGLGSDASYLFKHALVQEAAYGSLLQRDRQRQHGRIADVLLEQFDERCAHEPQLPARHLAAAERHAEAIPWWVRAGRQAQRRSANREALVHFRTALDSLNSVAGGSARQALELDIRTAMGPTVMALGGYTAPEVEATYQRALTLARAQGETPTIVPVLFGLWTYYVVRADFATARDLGEQLLRLAEAARDDDLLIEACTMLGVTLFHTADIDEARAYLERGIALYDSEQHGGHALVYGQDPGMACRTYLASVLWWLGYPDRALAISEEGIALARKLGHAHSLAFALYISARFRHQRGDLDASLALAEEAVALSAKHGFPIWQTLGSLLHGRVLVDLGDHPTGLDEIATAVSLYDRSGAGISRPYHLALQAGALGLAGRIDEALATIETALAYALATNAETERSEILRVRAELELRRGERERAEAGFREALELASRQGGRSFALRAATSLAALLHTDGRNAAARAVLEPVHSAFGEGLATHDLIAAAELLARIGRH